MRSRPDLRPDLVVAHGGRGAPTLFLPELLDCPLLNYCEYYFAQSHSDMSYRIDLPPVDPAELFPRCINAPTLASLAACDGGYSATQWQRQSFPERFWPKIEVHFDGIDTQFYQPREVSESQIAELLDGRSLSRDTRLVTYVARGLESMRGFDIFMRAAHRIAQLRSDVLFVAVGSEQTYYGWDMLHTDGLSFKQWVLNQDSYDLSRFVFPGHIEPSQLALLLARSDLHMFLTVPFVPSWSLFNALSAGCTVLASDVAPVREVIEPGEHGLVEPFFDVSRLTDTALKVLDDPAAFAPLGQAARERVREKYCLDLTLPGLKSYFERMAAR